MVEFTLVYIKIKKTISTQYPTLVSSFIPGIYLNTLIQTVQNTQTYKYKQKPAFKSFAISNHVRSTRYNTILIYCSLLVVSTLQCIVLVFGRFYTIKRSVYEGDAYITLL